MSSEVRPVFCPILKGPEYSFSLKCLDSGMVFTGVLHEQRRDSFSEIKIMSFHFPQYWCKRIVFTDENERKVMWMNEWMNILIILTTWSKYYLPTLKIFPWHRINVSIPLHLYNFFYMILISVKKTHEYEAFKGIFFRSVLPITFFH